MEITPQNAARPTPAQAAYDGPAAAGRAPRAAGIDWRRQAMDGALRQAAGDGTPLYAVLRAVHRHLPGHTARVFWENRNRILEALGRILSPLEAVIMPAVRRDDEGIPFPVFGWWRGTAPGTDTAFEIALAPDFYGDGGFLVAGPDAAAVNALVDRIIEDATRHTCRCLRFISGGWQDAPEMQAEVDKIGWDDIVLAPELLADIRGTVDSFFGQREVFASLRFPWRRGVLLVGPPGTGKTMACKAAAAAHPEVPFLYVRDLRSCRDAIADIFARARKLAPCILALEDVEGLITRDNRTVFLNELDGFRNNDGLLIIASSNHPGQIDEALLKRPSRFDRVYHVGLPEPAERAEYCRRLLGRTPGLAPALDAEDLAQRVAAMTEGFTPAFLKEAFLSAMLQMAQEGRTDMDGAFAAAVVGQVETLRTYLKKAKNPAALADLTGTPADGIGFRSR